MNEEQADALSELLSEIIATAGPVKQLTSGQTVFTMILSPDAADTLAAYRAEFCDDELEDDDECE